MAEPGPEPAPAIPEAAVPGPVEIHPPDLAPDASHGSEEVTVLGVSIVAVPTWWSLLLATYAYLLPLILYVAWVTVALWDIIRQEGIADRRRMGWMAIVLLVPLLGPVLYYVVGRSPIPRSLRVMLVAGGMGVYALIAALAVLAGSA